MKKIITNVMFVAVAAMAFNSCQKQELVSPETGRKVMLSFASEKPVFEDETKTEWTGSTIQWSKDDKIAVAYTVDEIWQNANGNANEDAKLYKSEPLKAAATTAKFNVSASFNGEESGRHVFYGVYPAPDATAFPGAPSASLNVPARQSLNSLTFDKSADLMTGVSVDEFTTRPENGETISMRWTRLVAHAYITLKDIKDAVEGEIVSGITLTAQDGANLVGKQKVDIQKNVVTKDNSASNAVELANGSLTVDANGNVSFWVCVLPETITSLTVLVETDKATYTRVIPSCNLEFKQNARNTLVIKMNEAVREEKVVASDEIVDVLNRELTGVTGTSYTSWSGKTSVSAAVYAGQSAGGNESIQMRSSGSNSGVVTTTSGGLAKKVVVKWHSATSTGRTLQVYGSSSAYTNPTQLYDSATSGELLGTIVCGTSTELVIEGEYEYIGMKSSSGAMYLEEIKITWSAEGVTPDTTPSITVEETLELTSAESEGTIPVTYKNLEDLDAAAYSDADCTEDCDWLVAAWENDASENGAVSYIAAANEGEERTAYIQIYALDAEANEYTKVITVTQAAYVDPGVVHKVTVTEFNALEGTETATYELTGTVAEIYQAYNSTYDNISFYIEDETGKVLIFRMDCGGDSSLASLKTGDKVTVQGTPTLYNSSIQMAEGGVCTYYQAACNAPEIICVDNLVTITAETGATIYYTTDGNDPTTSSDVYSSPFEVTEANSPMTVKAIAVADGKVASVVASKTCTYVDPNGGGEIGEERTITLTLNSATTGKTSTSYVQTANTFTYDDVTYSVNNWNPSSLQIRGNQTTTNNMQSGKNFMLRNTTAIPGKIKSITITYTEGTIVAAKTYAQVGSAEIKNQTTSTSVNGTAGTNAVSWTFNDGGSYFAIGMIKGGTSGTTKSGTITIVYQAN